AGADQGRAIRGPGDGGADPRPARAGRGRRGRGLILERKRVALAGRSRARGAHVAARVKEEVSLARAAGLADFWAVFDAHYDEVISSSLNELTGPGTTPAVQ